VPQPVELIGPQSFAVKVFVVAFFEKPLPGFIVRVGVVGVSVDTAAISRGVRVMRLDLLVHAGLLEDVSWWAFQLFPPHPLLTKLARVYRDLLNPGAWRGKAGEQSHQVRSPNVVPIKIDNG